MKRTESKKFVMTKQMRYLKEKLTRRGADFMSPVEVGLVAKSIMAGQEGMTVKVLSEMVGTYPSKISNGLLSLKLPKSVQAYIKDGSVTQTLTEYFISMRSYRPDVLEMLAHRIAEDALDTDEGRAIIDVVKRIHANEGTGDFDCSDEDLMCMYTYAINSPKEKATDPRLVALRIGAKVQGKDPELQLALSPAQVYIPTAVEAPVRLSEAFTIMGVLGVTLSAEDLESVTAALRTGDYIVSSEVLVNGVVRRCVLVAGVPYIVEMYLSQLMRLV